LFILCAVLGFIPRPGIALQILMTIFSIVFFLPGALLLRLSHTSGDRSIAELVRNFSAASLILTAVLLILNFLSVLSPALLGNILHIILVVVSTPMICSGYWVLSMFLWACLMICSMKLLRQKHA
jgi:hypothetical protein